MTADLIAFLRARLDEEDQLARAARREQVRYLTPGLLGRPLDPDECAAVWDAGGDEDEDGYFTRGVWANAGDVLVVRVRVDRDVSTAEHIARWDPARVLADVASKRAILNQCERWLSYGPVGPNEVDRAGDGAFVDAASEVLRLLAQSHAGHEDYRDDWRPA